MKIAIFGAGAIGAFLGAKLARAGVDVTLIARGPHLDAMHRSGVRVREAEDEYTVQVRATDDPAKVGEVDYLFLTVKAHSLPGIVGRVGPMLGSNTAVVSAQNGIPWWYFQRHGGPLDGTQLESLDPGGVISDAIAPERIIGCVVYPTTVIAEPGVIHHLEGNRFSLGELDGERSDRCRELSRAIISAGLKSPVSARIRRDLWIKLLGNVAFNPISALTGATMVHIAAHPGTRALARAVMEEADAVADALGVRIPISVERRLAGAEAVGEHKTSMLQDVESGRPLEVESVVGAVVELGDKLGLPMTNTRAVYACTNLLAARIAPVR